MTQVFGAPVAGKQSFGSGGLGILGSVIRATTADGDNGPGCLYEDWDSGDDNTEFGLIVTTYPSSGTLVVDEYGRFVWSGGADGATSFSYDLKANGVVVGSATETLLLGDVGYRPSADESVIGWVGVPSSNLFENIDETSASSADFIKGSTIAAPARFTLNTSMPSGSFDVSFRADVIGSGQMRVRFLNASNTDVGGTSWQALGASPTDYTLTATTTATATKMQIEVQP